MKKITTNCLLLFCCCFSFTAFAQDAVKTANTINDKKADKNLVVGNVADFLVKAFEGRMLATKESKLVAKKGSSVALRNLGNKLIKDQNTLYTGIKILAIKNNVTLPKGIGEKQLDNRDNLLKYNGKDFDLNFKKVLTLDLERDIKLFKWAADFQDPDVSKFAKKYLPMLESHLDKIKTLP